MKNKIYVMAENKKREEFWSDELQASFSLLGDLELVIEKIIFIDANLPNIHAALEKLDRQGKAVFLLVEDTEQDADLLSAERVDDVLIHPFRPLEILSKLKYSQQILMWDEVSRLNASFAEVLEQLREDVKLAERLQTARLPTRFPDISGFKVTQRYLAGLRSGGDYFDLAESREGNLMSIVLSDSSSYGLSSAVLSVLMRVALKLTTEEVRSTYDTVKRIQGELGSVLGERDRLSLFYGVVSRKDYRLRYLNLGSGSVFYANPGAAFHLLPSQGNPITRMGSIEGTEAEVQLEPNGRLMLISDGYVEILGGVERLQAALQSKRDREPKEILNELVFGVKSQLETDEDMPAQDCTAAIFDVESNIVRMVSKK